MSRPADAHAPGAHPLAPVWSRWRTGGDPWTVGIEEELILVDARTFAATNRIGAVMASAPPQLGNHLTAETHACVAEIRTDPCQTVGDAVAELAALRREVDRVLRHEHGIRAIVAGTHPLVQRSEVAITPRPRYQEIERTMRALAHREPTMGLHVHVAVPDGDAAVRVLDALRVHVPALVALAANSPFWRGEDSGFASIRTPLLDMFPRMGLPRAFAGYGAWVAAVDALVSSGAVPEPGFLWWDVRLQPALGTVEVRSLDAQTRTSDTAALAAVVQCLVRRHAEGPPSSPPSPETLEENRFLAARDGMTAQVIEPDRGGRVPMFDVVRRMIDRCVPVAHELGCEAELELARRLAHDSGAARQRRIASRHGIAALPERLASQFAAGAPLATTG